MLQATTTGIINILNFNTVPGNIFLGLYQAGILQGIREG
jgi:hypothetical protein